MELSWLGTDPWSLDVRAALLAHGSSTKRRPFALLERPLFPPHMTVEEYEYKVFVSGRNHVGKSSLCARLAAQPCPSSYSESVGLEASTCYWPAVLKGSGKLVMFKLHLVTSSQTALTRYDYIAPALLDKTDGIIFTFSLTDKSTFDDLPAQMSRIQEPSGNSRASHFVLGTKVDQSHLQQVSRGDIMAFEAAYSTRVLLLSNGPQSREAETELQAVSPILNYICDKLWKRDQELASQLRK